MDKFSIVYNNEVIGESASNIAAAKRWVKNFSPTVFVGSKWARTERGGYICTAYSGLALEFIRTKQNEEIVHVPVIEGREYL